MTTTQRSRVPAGVPTGGRFAPTARPEADIQLDDYTTSSRPPAIPAQRDGGDIAGLKAGIAASRHELGHADSLTERARILDDIASGQQRLIDLLERDTVRSGDGDIVGSFGSVSVMPRASESGPGTLVIVDTSGQTDGKPVVVMVNDDVIRIPVEEPEHRSDSELRDVDAALERHYKAAQDGDPAAEAEVQRLLARGAALAAVGGDPNCSYLDLDWGDGGLVAVASRDAFGDPRPAPHAPTDIYTTNLHPSDGACAGLLTAQRDGTFRLDVDAALGRSVF